MSRARKNLLEGTVTLAIGLVLWMFTGGVEVPVVTLTKAGVVLMCVGGLQVTVGAYQTVRTSVR
ncbi:DUF5708 family protein [Streptomyces cavernae]|uniref:DUF5708 family protein n=1 Tax=Streptomyces cavernae TaxID=2259034 RepID=UPI000FEBA16B|nr:DUF5708 family protein [Streptomyces cavernae]